MRSCHEMLYHPPIIVVGTRINRYPRLYLIIAIKSRFVTKVTNGHFHQETNLQLIINNPKSSHSGTCLNQSQLGETMSYFSWVAWTWPSLMCIGPCLVVPSRFITDLVVILSSKQWQLWMNFGERNESTSSWRMLHAVFHENGLLNPSKMILFGE